MAKLNVLSNGSTVLTDFTEGITKAGILITSGYTGQTPDNYLPGIFWSNNNISQNLPKAGIWVKQNGGTDIYFGTSSDYTQGLNSRVVFDQRGNVGIGTNLTTAKLTIKGNSNGSTTSSINIINSDDASLLFVGDDGNIGFGTTCPTEKLSVNGKVRVRYEIFIHEAGTWCDFVFDNDYKRMRYEEKEIFYNTNKHLFSVPSEKEINTTGLPVVSVLKGLTLNTEENSLDIIDLFKRLEILEKENAELKRKLIEIQDNLK